MNERERERGRGGFSGRDFRLLKKEVEKAEREPGYGIDRQTELRRIEKERERRGGRKVSPGATCRCALRGCR